MKKSRFSEEKIIAILKQAEAGMKVSELAASTVSRRRRFTTGRQSTAVSTSRNCGG